MMFLALLLMTALISFGFTALILRHSERLRLVQIPNHRSSHTHPTPTGGGLGIVLATIGIGIYLVWGSFQLLAILGLALPLALIGLLDDIWSLPARIRFGVQLAVCTSLLLLLHPIQSGSLILFSLLLFAAVWWINLFNFMDGIDGLAGTQAFFMLLMGAILSLFYSHPIYSSTWILILCTASATLGFLLLNWPPAKIFMGDVGSTWLAFMIFALALLTIHAGWLKGASWLILAAVFVTDATVTLFIRIIRGERWHDAHRSHVYQQLSRRWQGDRKAGHRSVTLLVAAINLFWLAPLAWACLHWPTRSVELIILAYVPLIIAALLLGAGKREHV